jgi:hypothetical protein
MADMETIDNTEEKLEEAFLSQVLDVDPAETAEWLDSFQYVLKSKGPDRAKYLLTMLQKKATLEGVGIPTAANTPYVNTIPVDKQPVYPGNRELERRIKSIIRWNAMAMVEPIASTTGWAVTSRRSRRRPRCTKSLSTISCGDAARAATMVISCISRAMPRRACTPAPSWKAACRNNTW